MRRLTVLAATVLFASASAFAQTVEDYSPLPPPPLPDDSSQAVESPQTGTPRNVREIPPGTTAPTFDPYRAPAVTSPAPRPPPTKRVRRTRITTGPLTPLAVGMDGISLEVEHAFGENYSLFLGPRFGAFPKGHVSLSSGLRFFPYSRDTAPAGFWIGPELWTAFEYTRSAVSGGVYAYSDIGVIGLAMAGYTVVYGSGFTMSFGAGLGGGVSIKSGSGPVLRPSDTEVATGVGDITGVSGVPSIALHWNVGYAF